MLLALPESFIGRDFSESIKPAEMGARSVSFGS